MSIPLNIKVKLIFSLNKGYTNQQTVILKKSKSESLLHIILKLLALIYFYKSNHALIIEPKFRYRGFKPDLISFKNPEIPQEVSSEVEIWIECKKVKISKLKALARYLPASSIYWFHLNHFMTGKLKNQLTSTNVELIRVKMTRKGQIELEQSLLTQSPVWYIHQYQHSQFTIGTLKSQMKVDFQVNNRFSEGK